MNEHIYISEKLHEFAAIRAAQRPPFVWKVAPEQRATRITGTAIRTAGRCVRRVGEMLESWGTHAPEVG